jgi:hypothetical protein
MVVKGGERSLNVCRNYNTPLLPGRGGVLELCWKLMLDCSTQLCQGVLKVFWIVILSRWCSSCSEESPALKSIGMLNYHTAVVWSTKERWFSMTYIEL